MSATPAFARTYQTSCQTCHIGFPKLNAFGEAFRLNGYRMPKETEDQIKMKPVSLGAEAYKRMWPRAIYPIYGGTNSLIRHRAHGYRYTGSAFVNAEHYDDSQAFSMGGFLSTALDLARWTSGLHHQQVLSAAAYQEMITPAVLPGGEALTYGAGVELGSIGHDHLLSHAGGGVGFMSQAIFVREQDLTIVALSNTITGGAALEVADRLMRKILGIAGPADLPLSQDAADRYIGSYSMDGEKVRILEQGHHLAIAYGDAEPRSLRYQGGGVFSQDGRLSRIHFRETNGTVSGFVVARYGSVLAKAMRVGS